MNRLNIARTLPILGLSLLCVAHAHAITLSPSQVSSTGYGIATYEAEWGGGLCILLGTCVTTPPPPTPLAGSFSHSSTYSSGATCASGGTAVSGGAYGQPPSGFYSNPGAYCVPIVSGGLSIGDSYPTYLYYPSGHASVVSQPPTTSYIQTGGMCVSGFGCAGGEVPYTTSYGAYLFSSTCSANYGNSCNSANNACGVHNTGTYSCSGTCSASVPANPPTYGKTCTSAPNSCGMTNTGTYGCTGACSATPPSDTLCAPVASCTVSPSSGYAGRTAFTWTASASGGNGSYTYSWSGTDGLSGSSASVSKTYATAGAKTGTVTVTSNGKPASAACTVSGGGSAITVNSCNPTLSANPSSIDLGQTTDLHWSIPSPTCASSCTFSDGHAVTGQSGSYTVTPPAPTSGSTVSYSISCPASSSQTGQTSVTVRVPTASITAAPDRVHSGDSSTITWSATNIDSCSITKNDTAWTTPSGATLTDIPADPSRNVASSSPDTVTSQTVYRISCVNDSGTVVAQAAAQAIVNVIPGFEQF